MNTLLITAAKMASGAEMMINTLYSTSSHTLTVTSGNPEVLSYFNEHGYQTHDLPGLVDLTLKKVLRPQIISLPRVLHHIKQAVTLYQPAYILVTNLISLLYVSLANLRPVPIVLHVHDHYTASSRHSWIARQLTKVPSVAICVSRGVYAEMITLGFPRTKLAVVHNGVTVSSFDVKAKLAKALNLPLELIFVGVLTPEKGPHLILESLHLLPEHLKPFLNFTLVGPSVEPTYTARLENLARTCGVKTHFVGKQSNARQWIYKSDLLIHASPTSDSFPTVVLEGMHEGCVVIAAKHTGAKELLTDQQTGFLINPREPQHLAQTLSLLLENLHLTREVATASHSYARNHLSLETARQNFFTLVEATLKG